MAIRKPIVLNWEGREYKIIIDMLLIDRIDDDLNILSLARMERPEDVKITKIARLIYILLDSVGVDVTPESVYQGMGGVSTDARSVFTIVGEILPQLLPNFESVSKKKVSRKKSTRKAKK